MIPRKALTLILLFLGLNSYAQQSGVLKGKVVDAANKETLPGAAIRLAGSEAVGTVTDSAGNYLLSLDTGVHRVYCVYPGMQVDTFVVYIFNNEVSEKNMILSASAEVLKTVVVTSGKFNQKLEEMTVSMEVLKPSLINNKNTTSIETALEQVPGLTIIDNDPQIRGGSGFTFGVGSRVAVVMDGIPLLSGDAGRPEWNYLPVENIEQVEIIKGASSVLYGSSALSGVINIRTAYPRSKPKTMINYSVGAYSLPSTQQNWYGRSLPGFSNLNFLHSRIVRKNLDIVVGGNVNVDQGYLGPPQHVQELPPDMKKAFHITDSVMNFTNKDILKVRVRANFNIRYRDQKIKGLSYGINGNGMYNKTNMVLAWRDDSSGLYIGYPGAAFLEEQTMFNFDPFIKLNKGNGVSHSLVTRIFHTNNVITNNLSNSGTLYFGEYQLQRNFKDLDLNFTGGVVGSLSTTHAGLYASSGTPDNKVVNAAGYLQTDKKFWDILNLSAGFRYEYFKTNDQDYSVAPIFRAGASLKVLKGTYVRSSFGQGYRYPTITERFILTKAGLFALFPNKDLKPETSKNFEIGLKQGFKIGSVMGYVDVAGFYQRYNNTIEFLLGIFEPSYSVVGFKFMNTGDSRIRGIDATLVATSPESNKKFGFTTMIGYTHVDPVSLTPDSVYYVASDLDGNPGKGKAFSYKNSSMDTTGNVLKYRFKHMVKLDIEGRLFTKFIVGVSYRYYSRMQNIDKAYQELESVTGDLHRVVPEYPVLKSVHYWQTHSDIHVVDMRVAYRLTEKQKVSLIISNLFNQDYSLRLLKAEAPRTTMLQYVYTF